MSFFHILNHASFRFGLIVALCSAAPSTQMLSPVLSATAQAAVSQVSVPSRAKVSKQSKFVRVTVRNGRRGGSYKPGTTITVTAVAPRRGLEFDSWEGPVSDPYSPTTTMIVPAAAVTIRAVFVAAGTAVRPVQVTIAGGAGSGLYRPGSAIAVSANAAPDGQRFARWTGDIGGLANPAAPITSLVVPAAAVSIAASYEAIPVGTVAVSVSGGTGSGAYQPGATVTIAANPAPDGQRFASWTGDIASLSNPEAPTTTLVVPPASVSLAATYQDDSAAMVEVTISGGTGSGRYKPGAVVPIYAFAAPGGKVFDRWDGPGVASPAEPVTALTVPAQATTIAATYKSGVAADVTLTVRGGTGSGSYKPGTTVRIAAAAPPAGQAFVGWIGDAVALADPDAPETDYRIGSTDATVEASFGDPGFVLTSHQNGDAISVNGETVFGKVTDIANLDRIAVQVGDDQRIVGVDKDGNFAFRVFREFITPGRPVDVTVTTYSTTSEAKSSTLRFASAQKDGALQQVLGRLTFGATPLLLTDLEARRKADPAGWYTSWVQEQLGINGKIATESAFITTLDPKATYIDNGLGQQSPTQKTGRYDSLSNAIALRIIPAAYSNFQLREVMAQFWDNHFHTSDQDGRARYSKTVDFQNYRDNALGTFRQLLDISATSGPMMWFLTNFVNTKGAINENYGREILELHTVGVDGGYTQDDVVAVAKLLTGRGVQRLCFSQSTEAPCGSTASTYEKTNFVYKSSAHVAEAITVPFLQKTYGPNTTSTMSDSNLLLNDLANHPKTKNFICKKIVEYLVSDEKPQYFIDKCANAWGVDGDIKAMLAAILLDPTYVTNGDLQRTKFRTPYEYAIGLLRHFAIDPAKYRNTFNNADAKYIYLAGDIRNIWEKADMDFFNFVVPTGFDEQASSVMMTSTLIARIDAATTFLKGSSMLTNRFAPLLTGSRNVTAEAAAAYLLKLATGDRYSRLEFEAVRNALQGSDGVFDPESKSGADSIEEVSVRKAIGLILTLPSYQLQ